MFEIVAMIQCKINCTYGHKQEFVQTTCGPAGKFWQMYQQVEIQDYTGRLLYHDNWNHLHWYDHLQLGLGSHSGQLQWKNNPSKMPNKISKQNNPNQKYQKKELTKFTIKKTKSQLSINNVFRVNYCTVHNKFSDIKPTDDNSSTSLKKKKMN